jgi:tetratricopeptide (TPR) repeat protein
MTAFRQTTCALVVLCAVAGWARPPSKDAKDTTSRARALTLEAKSAFNEGRFTQAAELLEQAYALEPSPSLLYNRARALQQAGDKRRAIEAWERYLASQPNASDEGAIRSSIQQLQGELASEAQLAERARAEKDRADREARERAQAEAALGARARTPSPWPWVAAGLGLAGVGVGGTLGAVAGGHHAGAVREPDALLAEQQLRRARDFAVGANVAFVVGGALALVGAVWGTFDLLSARPAVRVVLGPGALGLLGHF